jgi:hypothetical protein
VAASLFSGGGLLSRSLHAEVISTGVFCQSRLHFWASFLTSSAQAFPAPEGGQALRIDAYAPPRAKSDPATAKTSAGHFG